MRRINRPRCPNPKILKSNYKHPENKKALVDASFGKCIYCESKVVHVYYGDVEHLKPKTKYPELMFDWNNLGFVCAKCNGSKGDKYEEDTPYINPYEEEPQDHLIALGALLKHKLGSERGELTIIDIDLNRPELLEKRQAKIDSIQKAIDACMRTNNKRLKKITISTLLEESGESKEYSLFIKNLFRLHELI